MSRQVRKSWIIYFGLGLTALSAILYIIHYLIFRDLHHILIFAVEDIAFIPIEVLIVTLIIHRLLEHREKKSLLNKMNMVISAFFSEVGNHLLKAFISNEKNQGQLRNELAVGNKWANKDFEKAKRSLRHLDFRLKPNNQNLTELKEFLSLKRDFLVHLLENPNLLEHESFTELLWAVFHLSEELAIREGFDKSPPSDVAHLIVDMERAYVLLVEQWLDYMKHLHNNYPYLYSLAVRTNPFDLNASAVIQ